MVAHEFPSWRIPALPLKRPGNGEDVIEFETQSKDGNDADIKSFATKTLPTLQEHLKMAQAAAQKVGAK